MTTIKVERPDDVAAKIIRAIRLIDEGKELVLEQNWTPVTEGLPGKDELVLCIGAKGGMFLGKNPAVFSDGSAYFSVPNSRSGRVGTHWMPVIKKLPNATHVEPNRWIVKEDGNSRIVTCPACGKEYACHYGMLQLQNLDYCPACGSRMVR